jgi:hypothetical protein
LFGQPIAQAGVIIDDEYPMPVRHRSGPCESKYANPTSHDAG